ncbi:MAG: YceD family protein [Bryobacteraceae bacterium]
MFLSIKEMEVRKICFDTSFAPGELDLEGEEVRQSVPIRAEGTAQLLGNTGGEVRIEGGLEGALEADCDRCLGRVVFPLRERFDLFYRPMELGLGEELAIDEGEAEMGFYEGLGLELADVINEQVLLALPMQRVCRPDCKGICPVCGVNRNETECRCAARPVDDRWAALKKW